MSSSQILHKLFVKTIRSNCRISRNTPPLLFPLGGILWRLSQNTTELILIQWNANKLHGILRFSSHSLCENIVGYMKVAHWQHFRPVNDNLTLHWSSVCCMLSKRISSIGLFTTEITKLFAPRKKWSIAFEFDSHDHLECPDLWRLPYVWNCKTTHFVLLSYISKTSRVELCWKTSPSAQPSVTTYLFQTVESSLYTFISCCGLFLYFLTASLTSRRTPHKSGTPNGHMSKLRFKCDQSFFSECKQFSDFGSIVSKTNNNPTAKCVKILFCATLLI